MTKQEYPTLIIVRGLPGSGKTYVAQKLIQEFARDEIIMLDPDVVDQKSSEYIAHVKQATADGVDPKLHLYRFLRAQAYHGIAACKTIVWNQPFTNLEIFNKMMANMQLQATEHNVDLKVLVVEVSTDPTVAKQRVDARKKSGGHGPSDATFDRFAHDYHSFADAGYKTVSIDGVAAVEDSVVTVLAAIKNL
mgnify:CR=1 FL=1